MPKKFHVTPDGVRPCKAHSRPCPYGDHYTTEAGAIAATNLKRQRQERDDRNAHLLAQAKNKRLYSYSNGTVDGPRSLRAWSTSLPSTYEPQEPVYIEARERIGWSGDRDASANYTLVVKPEFDPMISDFVHKWRFYQDDGSHQVLEFETGEQSERSLAIMRSALEEGVRKTSSLSHESLETLVEPKMERLLNFFKSVSSESDEHFHVWVDGGPSFFEKSADRPDTIVAEANYSESTLRAATIERFAKNNMLLSNQDPTIEVAIYEKAPGVDGATWELRRQDNAWELSGIKRDGSTAYWKLATAEEAQTAMYWFVKDEFPDAKEEEVLERARYAKELFTGVEETQEWLHANVNNKQIDTLYYAQQAQLEHEQKTHEELLDIEKGARKPVIDKLMGLFNS